MDFYGKRIGFALTGSHCTYDAVLPEIKKLVELGAEVVPVVTYTVRSTNTKFGDGDDWLEKIEEAAGRKAIKSIVEAEPLGPREPLDCMVIAPLTGNSLSKLANGLTDSPVLMATKATLRNSRPVVLAISTNDALSGSAENIGTLLNRRNYYFVPFRQDNPITKPRSIVFDEEYIIKTIEYALNREQIEPIML